MAKNIEINIKTSTGAYEILYPSVNPDILKLNSGNINVDNSISESLGLGAGSTINDVLGKFVDTGVFSGYTEKIENDLGDVWNSESYSIDLDNGTSGTKTKSVYYLGSCQEYLVFYTIYYKQTGTTDSDKPIYSNWGEVVSFYNFKTKEKIERQLIFPDDIVTLSGLEADSSSPIFLENDGNLLFFTINGVFVDSENDFNFSFYPYKLSRKNRDVKAERAIYYNGTYACYFGYNVVYSIDLITWSVDSMSQNTHDFASVGGGYIWFVYHPNSALVLYKSTSVNSIGTLEKQLRNYSYCSSCSQSNDYLFLTGNYSSSSSDNYLIVYDIKTGESHSNSYGNNRNYVLDKVFYSNNYYYGSLDTDDSNTGTVFVRWNKGTTPQEISTNILNAKYLKTRLGTDIYYSEGNNLCLCVFNNSGNWNIYNYTQRTYLKDYNLVNSLSELITLGDSYRKVELTSYIGNGNYGSSNPNSVTFSFNPKLIIVIVQGTGVTRILMMKGQIKTIGINTNGDSGSIALTWISNGISWYNESSAVLQCNEINLKYLAFGIG